ncbi:cupin domain-containing protein [Nocardioides currus]|uniref:Cupin n=1 Tax=Nocardioides currus TaxID=2133958 RepID=A0A2R7YY18_9ACTN|nr:cupin domain-containing protein [Nocardioides currus]PUA81231.1 cupin [Nocardioides currus]
MTDPRIVNLHQTLASFEDLWSPRILAQVNDHDLRTAKVRGEYVWHRHPDTDELFLVLDGQLDIGLRDEDGTERVVALATGDVFVVPRNLLHRPSSAEGATILLVEPTGTVTTGDFDGEVPDHIDSTVGHRVSPD